MQIERIVTPGLAHYSYIIADGGRAAVIDPRRDVEVYLAWLRDHGARLERIFETHRHEDFIVGSVELARLSGATIHHAEAQLDHPHGEAVYGGESWRLGGLTIEALATPGHTPGSISYLVREPAGEPWLVFTGDTLFAGDLGRVDLPGVERMEEMAGLLYDSLQERLLPLGDGVIVCPAHGAGSVCGAGITERPWTTIGLERRLNPKLRHSDRAAFIEAVAVELERPPYFRRSEEWNLHGPPPLATRLRPPALSPDEFAEYGAQAQLVDTRPVGCFAAAHPPGSLSLARPVLAGHAGWLLDYERPILLITPLDGPVEEIDLLRRMGFDNLGGVLAGGMTAWEMAGRPLAAVETLTTRELCALLDSGERPELLDVRSEEELESQGRIAGARHIPLTRLAGRLDELDGEAETVIFCGSGIRSMSAAALLRRAGVDRPRVALGGLSAWSSTACPLEL